MSIQISSMQQCIFRHWDTCKHLILGLKDIDDNWSQHSVDFSALSYELTNWFCTDTLRYFLISSLISFISPFPAFINVQWFFFSQGFTSN